MGAGAGGHWTRVPERFAPEYRIGSARQEFSYAVVGSSDTPPAGVRPATGESIGTLTRRRGVETGLVAGVALGYFVRGSVVRAPEIMVTAPPPPEYSINLGSNKPWNSALTPRLHLVDADR